MFKDDRQDAILELLAGKTTTTVPELSERFGVSEVTIRRDLHDLSASGKIRRAHRGAIRITPAPPEPPITQRMTVARPAKERIVREAVKRVSEGDSVFVGSGSTTTLMARHLRAFKRLTVVTNSISVASELALAEGNISVIVTGGELRGAELSLLGYIAESSLTEIRISKVFMGAQALSVEGGFTTDFMSEVATTRYVINMAPMLVVLADRSKIERVAAAFIVPLDRISTIIADAPVAEDFVSGAQTLGVEVVQA